MFPRHALRRLAAGATVLVVAGALGAVAIGTATAAAPPRSGCADIETIAARGTTERQGGGIVAGPLATALQQQLPQTVQTHDLVYPASFNYRSSVRQGVEAMRERLAETAAECPDTEFVLIGYSQGADVIGDVLAGGSVPAADRIDAVVLFGDPTFRGADDFNLGSFSPNRNGTFARQAGELDAFADEIGSFCRGNDTICQRGANGSGHFRYGDDRAAAVDFVEGQLS